MKIKCVVDERYTAICDRLYDLINDLDDLIADMQDKRDKKEQELNSITNKQSELYDECYAELLEYDIFIQQLEKKFEGLQNA